MRKVASLLAGLLAAALSACASVPLAPPLPPPPVHANGGTLWRIISTQCLPGLKDKGDPSPCASVSLQDGETHGFVLLKDRDGVAQYLLMPSAKITGVEDPLILASDAANYFAKAWASRGLVEAKLGKPIPREAMSIAVNSQYGRSQDQLHLHIDCLDPKVQTELRAIAPEIGSRWSSHDYALNGQPYRVRRLKFEELGATNPFRLLASDMPGMREPMAGWTLVLVGERDAKGQPSFLLIAGRAEPAAGHEASGEDLQDHACHIMDGR